MGIHLILYYVVSVVLKLYWCSYYKWLVLESDVELLYFKNVTLAYDDDWNHAHKMVITKKISWKMYENDIQTGLVRQFDIMLL